MSIMKQTPATLAPLGEQPGMILGSTRLMNAVSHAIEDVILHHHMQVELFVGFQRFSRFVRQLDTYRRLACTCSAVHVWGIPDVRVPAIPGVHYHPLDPTDPMAQEWFMVVDTPAFFTALLLQETPPVHPSAKRSFEGIWTHSDGLVSQASMLLHEQIGRDYTSPVQRDYKAQSGYINDMMIALLQHHGGRLFAPDPPPAHMQVYARAIRQSDTPLVLLTADKHVLAASATACAILGETSTQVVGKPLHDCGNGIFAQRDPTDTAAPLKALLRVDAETVLSAETEVVQDDHGTTSGWLIKLHEARQHEPRYARSRVPYNEALAPLIAQLQQQHDHLRAVLPNTPETRMGLTVQQTQLDQMQHTLARLHKLHHIMTQGEVTREPVSVEQAIKRVLHPHYAALRRNGVMPRVTLMRDLPALRVATCQFEGALHELLDNVYQHAHGATDVHIRAWVRGGHYYISVQDNGCGIDPADRPRIFRPLPRTGFSEWNTDEPVGLGLHIVREVTLAHHGHLQIESAPQQGSTFTLQLPHHDHHDHHDSITKPLPTLVS